MCGCASGGSAAQHGPRQTPHSAGRPRHAPRRCARCHKHGCCRSQLQEDGKGAGSGVTMVASAAAGRVSGRSHLLEECDASIQVGKHALALGHRDGLHHALQAHRGQRCSTTAGEGKKSCSAAGELLPLHGICTLSPLARYAHALCDTPRCFAPPDASSPRNPLVTWGGGTPAQPHSTPTHTHTHPLPAPASSGR